MPSHTGRDAGPATPGDEDVRGLVESGDVAAAADRLGRPYTLRGTVVHGDAIGRVLGFPTANLAWTGNPPIPADGVYAGHLVDGHYRWPAAISVGTNPQFHTGERRIETFVIDQRDLHLYGDEIGIEFVARLRGQLTFPDVSGLEEQMSRDVDQARAILAQHLPADRGPTRDPGPAPDRGRPTPGAG